MHSAITFIRSGKFFIQLGIIILLVILIIYSCLKWMSSYTNHGQFVVVPDFKGKMISQLDDFIKGQEVSYQIIDSIYDPKEKAGIVLRQDPEMNSKVKHNRTVYLYVTGMVPPQVRMPKLVDRSERQARLIISSYGLKVGGVEERHADCNGCVIEQLVKGRQIEEGKGIPKGSVVDLVVGRKDAFYNTEADSTIIPEEN